MDLINVDPRALEPNPWNTNVVTPENQEKIEASLRRHGWVRPVVARRRENGVLQILGGEHRVRVAISMGETEVPVLDLGEVSDARAKEIGLIDNARYGSEDATQLSELLAEIGDPHEIASFLPFGEEELNSLFGKIEVDLDSLDLEDEERPEKTPRPPKTHSMMRFKVPIDDADAVSDLIEEIKRAQGFTQSDSLSNAGDALVWLIETCRDRLRETISGEISQ